MTSFDLVFAASFLFAVGLFVRAMYLLVRRRWKSAARTGVALAAFVGVYAVVLLTVSLTSSPRYYPLGTEFRFDDWCFAVERVETAPVVGEGRDALRPAGVFRLVTVRVLNRGRGRAQREKNVGAYLLDAAGHRYD